MRALAAGLAATALVAVAGSATSSPGSLTPAERNAVRLVSVKAFAAGSQGTTVEATFAGNVTDALGRGHLKTGLVAVLVRPAAKNGQLRGVATDGAGPIGRTYALRIPGAGVLRDGRRLFFLLPGIAPA